MLTTLPRLIASVRARNSVCRKPFTAAVRRPFKLKR